MRLIYLNYSLSSVFESQVLEILVYFNRLENNEIHLCCGYLRMSERNKIQELCNKVSIKVTFFKAYPNFPFLNFLNRISLHKAIVKLLGNNKNTVIHVRGELAAFFLKKVILKCNLSINRVLVDVRGSAKEEINQFKEFNTLKKWLKTFNYSQALNNLKSYKYINAISPALKKYLIKNAGIDPFRIAVISNFAAQKFSFKPERRISVRKELGISENEVLFVVSSGGTGQWQNNEIIIELANNGYKTLNLSRLNIPHPNIINLFVPYYQVADYLQAADIAVIMRTKSIVNEVSSPVKFSEFICSGLPVIANQNIQLINDYIEKTGFGFVTKSIIDLSPKKLEELVSISRQKIADYGKVHFGINAIASQYNDLYYKMMK